MTWTSFDEYMNEQFKKYCPDAAKFLDSINPIAKKAAESHRFFFTIGMITHLNLTEDEVIEWDLAYAQGTCKKCEHWSDDDPCEHDPTTCEIFKLLNKEVK